MTFITILILAVTLVIINYMMRMILTRIKRTYPATEFLLRYLPLTELLIWTIFIIWAINILMAESRYLLYINTLIILTIAAFLSWYFLRDYVAGVQIKSRFKLHNGQIIKIGKLSGKISRLGLLSLHLKSDKSGNIILPYGKIRQEEIQYNIQSQGHASYTFIIDVDSKISESEVSDRLTEVLMNSIWCSASTRPTIKMIGDKGNKQQYEIGCFPVGDNAIENLILISKKAFSH